jgi:hypothetical protein
MQITFEVIEWVFDLAYTHHSEFADVRHNCASGFNSGTT